MLEHALLLLLGLLHQSDPAMTDSVSTNLLMSEYKKRNCLSQVLHLLAQMRAVGQKPDTVTYNIVCDACEEWLEAPRGVGAPGVAKRRRPTNNT